MSDSTHYINLVKSLTGAYQFAFDPEGFNPPEKTKFDTSQQTWNSAVYYDHGSFLIGTRQILKWNNMSGVGQQLTVSGITSNTLFYDALAAFKRDPTVPKYWTPDSGTTWYAIAVRDLRGEKIWPPSYYYNCELEIEFRADGPV